VGELCEGVLEKVCTASSWDAFFKSSKLSTFGVF
jgi:hypothetical protein